MSSGPSDQPIREEALDTRRSFIYEAPAGSGKTALLVARYLALLCEVKDPRQVLAITFTRKAAAEMAERIGAALKAAFDAAPAPNGEWEARLHELARRAAEAHAGKKAILLTPGALRVTTFHGFCAEVVRGWPLEAGFPPGTGLLEDLGQKALIDEAVSNYMGELVSGAGDEEEMGAFKRRLAAANNRLATLSGQLAELLARRDRLPAFANLLAKGDPGAALEERLSRLLDVYIEAVSAYFIKNASRWRALKEALGESEMGTAMPAEVPGGGVAGLEEWRKAATVFLTKAGTPRQSLTPSNGFPGGFGKRDDAALIKELPGEVASTLHFLQALPESGDDPCGASELGDVLLLAAKALAWLQSAQAERGIDFMALELSALKALGRQDCPGDSLIFSHERLRHLLVDEAQDVNDSQVKILGLLAEGWSEGDGRTIFVVGDPKQSIYRFRRAEVSLFEDLRERGLARRDEERLRMAPRSLSRNFRSRPCLVNFSNSLFARVMDAPKPEYDEARFEASVPEREEAAVPREIEVALFSCRARGSKDERWRASPEARQMEAAWVARRVSDLMNEISLESGGAAHKTIAVLVPARTHLDIYVRAFADASVPVKVVEGVAMADRPEVRALHSLLVALLRPHDDLAWAQALRAPWCGASDADLARIAALPAPTWAERVVSLKETGGRIGRFAKAIAPFLATFGRGDLSTGLLGVWEELNGPSVFADRWGKRAAANALAYIGLLTRAGVGEEAIESVERKLGAAYTPPDPGAAFSSVSLMTIHKAKGLEFDFVFAAGLDYLPKRGRENDGQPFVMTRVPGKERLDLAAVSADRRTGRKTLGFQLLSELEFRRSLSEHKRLMYVAATRAREGLALSALRSRKKDEEDCGNDASSGMAGWLRDAFEECVFDDVPARLLEDPEAPAAEGAKAPAGQEAAAAPPFKPQPLPYTIHSPSNLREIDDETALPSAYAEKATEPWAREKGVVMHRLFEALALGRPLPSPNAVATAFLKEGLGGDEAASQAARALEEVARAWNCEAFAKAREGAEYLPEYGLEVAETTERILAGRLDLLIRTRDGAVVVDYKTGSPAGDAEEWMNREVRAYAPQIEAYRRMAAACLGLDAAKVGGAVLFTAVPALRWV